MGVMLMTASRSIPRCCVLLAVVGLAFFVSPAAAVDILLTSTGELDFRDDPIPADFFAPGSLPFDGVISLVGVPINPSLLGPTDTIIERGPVFGGAETVPIELVQLNLRSIEPIQVNFGASPPSFFDVFVSLDAPTPTGAMQLQQTSPSGGVMVDSHFNSGNVHVDWIVIGPGSSPFMVIPDAMDLLNGPVPFDYVPPSGYPGASGFYPGPQDYHGETGPLSFRLIPAPEPSSFVLAGCGLAVLVLIGRRMRRG